MATVRALVLRAPGTNCDHETAHAFELAGARADRIHVHRLLESTQALRDYQILCVPGGFSYGDDVAAGRILATILRTKLADELREFRDRQGLILGICNGFQILLQTGLVVAPDPNTGQIPAALTLNRQGRFENRWVHLAMTSGRCAFVRSDEVLELPIAHAEGQFVVTDPSVIEAWSNEQRIVARYVDADGRSGSFPINPNGSMGDIAGLCDASGRVFCLMPHPERHVFAEQHPRWTRRKVQPAEGDGLRIFKNAVSHFS